MTLSVHDGIHESLLTRTEGAKDKEISMHGLLNLLILLLAVTNIKNVILSLQQHGFLLRSVLQEFLSSRIYTKVENYQTIAAIFTLPAFNAISFWIEVYASNRDASRTLVFLLVVLNQAVLLLYPIGVSFLTQADMLVGSALVLFSLSTSLKLISFHHVMHDVRGLVLRVI
jgi:hypothetical protein